MLKESEGASIFRSGVGFDEARDSEIKWPQWKCPWGPIPLEQKHFYTARFWDLLSCLSFLCLFDCKQFKIICQIIYFIFTIWFYTLTLKNQWVRSVPKSPQDAPKCPKMTRDGRNDAGRCVANCARRLSSFSSDSRSNTSVIFRPDPARGGTWSSIANEMKSETNMSGLTIVTAGKSEEHRDQSPVILRRIIHSWNAEPPAYNGEGGWRWRRTNQAFSPLTWCIEVLNINSTRNI